MRYRVTALVDSARVVTVSVDAGDAEGARALAQGQGYAVLNVSRSLALNSFRPVARRMDSVGSTADSRLMPSGVNSNAQAMINASDPFEQYRQKKKLEKLQQKAKGESGPIQGEKKKTAGEKSAFDESKAWIY